MDTKENITEKKTGLSFVEQFVEEDLAEGKNGGRIQTRQKKTTSMWKISSAIYLG